ncbi:hypothetical protein F6Q07_20085 [Pectobacterium parmentieri]|uniref:hypothetical protein n=1 Tax=Pectobacterium parmentieri TaxID=1905730 RepID=UPI0018E00A45|nr:hypothetical protein [Pectobacterium parmentieri]
MDANLSIVRPGASDNEEIRLIVRIDMGKTITVSLSPKDLALALTGVSDVPATIKTRNLDIRVKD